MSTRYDESIYSGYYITRRRFLPDEIVTLKDDKILYMDEDLILTHWASLTPKKKFSGGISAYYPKENWKISMHYRNDGTIFHWYCDMMESHVHEDKHIETVDMLLDVIMENGQVLVVDSDELAEVLEDKKITQEFAVSALKSMDKLLRKIYAGEFDEIAAPVNEAYRELVLPNIKKEAI